MRPEVNVKVKLTQNGMHHSATQEESTHQIWDSYIKKYRRYAPDTIILETRSKVKITVT